MPKGSIKKTILLISLIQLYDNIHLFFRTDQNLCSHTKNHRCKRYAPVAVNSITIDVFIYNTSQAAVASGLGHSYVVPLSYRYKAFQVLASYPGTCRNEADYDSGCKVRQYSP